MKFSSKICLLKHETLLLLITFIKALSSGSEFKSIMAYPKENYNVLKNHLLSAVLILEKILKKSKIPCREFFLIYTLFQYLIIFKGDDTSCFNSWTTTSDTIPCYAPSLQALDALPVLSAFLFILQNPDSQLCS